MVALEAIGVHEQQFGTVVLVNPEYDTNRIRYMNFIMLSSFQ